MMTWKQKNQVLQRVCSECFVSSASRSRSKGLPSVSMVQYGELCVVFSLLQTYSLTVKKKDPYVRYPFLI